MVSRSLIPSVMTRPVSWQDEVHCFSYLQSLLPLISTRFFCWIGSVGNCLIKILRHTSPLNIRYGACASSSHLLCSFSSLQQRTLPSIKLRIWNPSCNPLHSFDSKHFSSYSVLTSYEFFASLAPQTPLCCCCCCLPDPFRGMEAWRETMEPQKPSNSPGSGPEVVKRQRVGNSERRKESVAGQCRMK